MDMHENQWNRRVPLAFALYNMYLKVEHTGMKLSDILKLNDKLFAPIFCTSLHVTCDAGLVTYERDMDMAMVFSIFGGMGIQPVSTENMVGIH